MNPESIEKLIEQGRDSAEARVAAGQARLKAGDAVRAEAHFRKAVEFNSDYSVAWQMLGKACLEQGRATDARRAWERGLDAAGKRGDRQVEKVLKVWLGRLERENSGPQSPDS